ncbi:hypothetical protein [Nocardia sp. NPDC050793]|uniref:hypothetical protein n=1 Tax=Nocardia sp. NPDC050793 TaxID=3155159 RepID=UPI0033DDD6E2
MAELHRDFVTGLAERLDIETGLREVLLEERHADFVDQVRDNLDIEAGLAAIIPPELPAELIQEHPEDDADAGSLQWASRELALMPLSTRLTLRAKYAPGLGAAVRDVLTIGQSASLNEGHLRDVRGHLEPIFKPLNVGVIYVNAPTGLGRTEAVRMYAESLKNFEKSGEDGDADAWFFDALTELRQRPGRTSRQEIGDQILHLQITTPFIAGMGPTRTPDPVGPHQWVAMVGEFVQWMLDRADDAVATASGERRGPEAVHQEISDALAELMSHLGCLEQMLNDFIGADLRDVDLAGVPLNGVRWSAATTRWPEHWIEQIERDSVSIGDGVFEIHYGTTAYTDTRV